MPLISVDATVMRGGTSRGIFLKSENVPVKDRDTFLIKLLGSPDPLQVDGLGGGFSSTSKAMMIDSTDTKNSIKYLFAQIYVDKARVDYNGNCGNLTSAVGPFAVEEGLVKTAISDEPKEIEINLFNQNTEKEIISRFKVVDGRPYYSGNNGIDGVPNTGVAVYYKIMNPAGTIPHHETIIEPSLKIKVEGKDVEVSVIDITSVYAFVNAKDIGMKGTELPGEVNNNPAILNRMKIIISEIKKKLGDRLLPETPEEESEMSLRLIAVSDMVDYSDTWGRKIRSSEGDILLRAFSLGKMHHSVPFTAALCTAAAKKIPDTVVWKVARNKDTNEIRIAHPKGIAKAYVESDELNSGIKINYVGGYRTARPIMKGKAFVQM